MILAKKRAKFLFISVTKNVAIKKVVISIFLITESQIIAENCDHIEINVRLRNN